ncbi:MAG: phospholipase D family protein [Betaproteobacteria bacterium]
MLRSAQCLLVFAMLSVLAGCASLPPLTSRAETRVLTDTEDTMLGRAQVDTERASAGKSGIYPLAQGLDAFAARAVLARLAERSLDVQYYIWRDDTTGVLLLQALHEAAERGVRVRLLLDDLGTHGLDASLAALDAHPNIEVRLFNPFASRKWRGVSLLTDFERLNRRMHNKSLTADGQASIVGGRNIGDEYFDAGDGALFADLDVLALGPVVQEVGAAFDLYWNSASAYPVALLLPKATDDTVQALRTRFAQVRASPEARSYIDALQRAELFDALRTRSLPLEWAKATLVYDEPVKALGKAEAGELLISRMTQTFGTARREIDIISPYFVPGAQGTEQLAQHPKRGVKLRILTNSLAASDVAAVHSGYARRRVALLAAGVELYEMKPDASQAKPRRKNEGAPGSSGSSGVSLHAKTFSMDRERVFVGSFNLDQRSVALNTEMGVVLESPALARALSDGMDAQLGALAYAVVLAPDGRLQWIERTPQGEIRHDTEPKTGWFKRFGVGVLSVLPIEWLL